MEPNTGEHTMDRIRDDIARDCGMEREQEAWLRGCNACGETMRVYESDPPTCGVCDSENVIDYGHDVRPSPAKGVARPTERDAGERGKPDPASLSDLRDAIARLENAAGAYAMRLADVSRKLDALAVSDRPQGGS